MYICLCIIRISYALVSIIVFTICLYIYIFKIFLNNTFKNDKHIFVLSIV